MPPVEREISRQALRLQGKLACKKASCCEEKIRCSYTSFSMNNDAALSPRQCDSEPTRYLCLLDADALLSL